MVSSAHVEECGTTGMQTHIARDHGHMEFGVPRSRGEPQKGSQNTR